MAAKKEHAHAFDKGTDADKLAATSEQYQEQTGQADEPEAGPDPIVEASDKAIADLKLDPVRDQADIAKQAEEEDKDS